VAWCSGGFEVTEGGTVCPCFEHLQGRINGSKAPAEQRYSTSTRTPP